MRHAHEFVLPLPPYYASWFQFSIQKHLLRSGDIEFQDVLRGLELTVSFPDIPGGGYINYDEEAGTFAENPGYWIVLLNELANRAGFSWPNWGLVFPLKHNKTTNELLEWAVDVYDFSFSQWDRTADRMKLGVDFPAGFSDSSTILIARDTGKDETSFNAFSFLRPFNWAVWISIVGTVIFTGLIYRWVSKVYSVGQSTLQPRDENVSEHVEGANIFYAALAATGHMEFRPVTYGERILVFSLCFWSLVMAATYTANLASVMISRHQPDYPAMSMTEADHRQVSVCVTKGFTVETKLKQAYPDVTYVKSEGLTGPYEDLRNNKCGLVATSAERFGVDKLNRTINPDCSLEWVGRAVDISSAGPANAVDAGIYCTSLVGHIFEYYLKDMQRDGFIERAFENYVNSVTTHQCPEEEEISSNTEDTFSLTMMDMGGIFLWHGVACVVGLWVAFIQRYCGSTRKRRSRIYSNENGEVGAQKDIEVNGENVIITARQLGSGRY